MLKLSHLFVIWLFFFVTFCVMPGVLPDATELQPPLASQVPSQVTPGAPEQGNSWIANTRQVHKRFKGQKGTFAHFGDSITVTLAFWTPLLYERKNASAEMQRAFATVKEYMRPECWRDWKGPAYGSEGGQTIRWAHDNVDTWLQKLNPEVAVIMFGTNDLHSLEADEYASKMRQVIQKCLDNGTIVILSTIPPRHGYDEKAAQFVTVLRDIAREMKVPLIDYYAAILQRRPDDWNGALDKFKAYEGYDVPTLIARDGVHPSLPKQYENDYSPEALSNSGYSLRNYLVLTKYAEVVKIINSPTAGNSQTAAPVQEKVISSNATSQVNSRRDSSVPAKPWFPIAPRLPNPIGQVIKVANTDELFKAVEQVKPGGTILVADGFYRLSQLLLIKTDNVTLRGASGLRGKVILDGSGTLGELVGVSYCSGVTIADLTVQNVRWNGIKINSDTNVQKVTVYNCVLHNIWQRGVKGVKVPEQNRERTRPTDCRIQYCLFYNDRPKQFSDDPADTSQNFNGDYIGGIDTMYAKGWIISDNVFIGIQGRTREARGAIFMWHHAEDCIIERNIIIDCDSGICLGNSSRAESTVHCTNFIVRNNFVTRAPENGILADYTRDCKIVNNTIYDPTNRLGRLIRLVHDNDGLLVANNLLCGPPVRNESQSQITFSHNLEKDISRFLLAPLEGNLRLTMKAVEAIDKATVLPEVTQDIDRRARAATPDIGAHEFNR
jgi:hypothetical protein